MKIDIEDRMNSSLNASAADMPTIGIAIAVVIFIYAWIADTSERKEGFTSNMGPPSRIETFYGGAPLIPPMNKAYAV
jgi:hypothetical protein